jgi:hypothetical protein
MHLERLGIESNAPSSVVGLAALAELPRLRTLSLRSTYDLDAAQLPDRAKLPVLASVTIDGVRKAMVGALAAKLAGVETVTIRRAKTDSWIAANADNPFRHWVDDGATPALARLAVRAWKRALQAIAVSRADLERALAAFIESFNTREQDIDTIRAEEIARAFDALVTRCGNAVDPRAAAAWFDKWRSF